MRDKKWRGRRKKEEEVDEGEEMEVKVVGVKEREVEGKG